MNQAHILQLIDNPVRFCIQFLEEWTGVMVSQFESGTLLPEKLMSLVGSDQLTHSYFGSLEIASNDGYSDDRSYVEAPDDLVLYRFENQGTVCFASNPQDQLFRWNDGAGWAKGSSSFSDFFVADLLSHAAETATYSYRTSGSDEGLPEGFVEVRTVDSGDGAWTSFLAEDAVAVASDGNLLVGSNSRRTLRHLRRRIAKG